VDSGAPITIGFSAAGAILVKPTRRNMTATTIAILSPSVFLIFPLLEDLIIGFVD
jgi:hypothetical protein